MTSLKLVIGPDPIFRQKADPVEDITPDILDLVDAMFKVLYAEKGIGLGANMVGVLKQIIVIDLQENGTSDPVAMINPRITRQSEERQTLEEASLSFPGLSAAVTRPKDIDVEYLDTSGEKKSLTAAGFLSTVIQHEIDYLEGRTFMDHLSRLKRERMMAKAEKNKKQMLQGSPDI